MQLIPVFLAQSQATAAAASPAAATGAAATGSTPGVTVDKLHQFYDVLLNYLPHLGSAVLILLVGWWLAGRVKGLLRRVMVARHVDVTLVSFLSQLCYWLILALVVVVAMENAQMATTPFSAVLGASALAVGLALQNSLTNFAAGVMIILFRHFRVGDDIEAGGVAGTVEEISIFDTHLKTADNRKIIVPNGKILGSAITNASAKPTRRMDVTFRISYESSLKLAKQIVLAELQGDGRVLPNPAPAVVVGALAENSVNLAAQAWVAIGDHDGVRSHLLEAVKLRFDEAGIVIPYPQQEVHLHKSE